MLVLLDYAFYKQAILPPYVSLNTFTCVFFSKMYVLISTYYIFPFEGKCKRAYCLQHVKALVTRQEAEVKYTTAAKHLILNAGPNKPLAAICAALTLPAAYAQFKHRLFS